MQRTGSLVATMLAFGLVGDMAPAFGQTVPPPDSRELSSLVGKAPPAPPDAAYNAIVANKNWLIVLGKALFWDEGVGSRSDQACASCHFQAGADPRTTNQLHPGFNIKPNADLTFGDASGLTGSGAKARPNYLLKAADFPFHKLADPDNRQSAVVYDTNDVASSAGALDGVIMLSQTWIKIRGKRVDQCDQKISDVFQIPISVGFANTRKVEPRNTPTMINAAFNRRNFWDGRANDIFNGVDPFGRRSILNDPTARVMVAVGSKPPALRALELPYMSLASQAVGPPRSELEMACAGRSFATIGRRVIKKAALIGQTVAADDSVFGAGSAVGSVLSPTRQGLAFIYGELIKRAFQRTYWKAKGFWNINPDGTLTSAPDAASGFSQMELNFSLFFGMAIDAYERTLISDQTPFDQGALSAEEQAGLEVFQNKGKCIACHDGPLFSKAATFQGDSARDEVIERMPMGDGGTAIYDNGFYNIGGRPAFEDIGVGGADPYGIALSFARQYLDKLDGKSVPDRFNADPCKFEVPFSTDPASCGQVPGSSAGLRIAVDGGMKVPTLRNIALTPPYLHNGGLKNLEEVVQFYNRGGDRRDLADGDTTGTGPLGRPNQATTVTAGMGGSNLDPDIGDLSQPNGGLGLSAGEQAQLVAFLKALSDRRVACHAAPFDHPELVVSIGHKAADTKPVDQNADDVLRRLPAVGASGFATCNFAQLNSGDLFKNNAMSLFSRQVPTGF